MSNTEFTFFPAVRKGYRPANAFSKGATSVDDPGKTAVTLDVKATGSGQSTTESVGVDLSVYGPGEVTNLDADQIVRMEPEPETTAFPPNYFPLVEFDDPGLPWLFSPESADGAGRNRPWLCLVVVEVEATAYKPAGTGPLPVLETPTDQLPDAGESWAWAHAQLVGGGDPKSAFGSRSNRTVSRLLCPRNLDPKTKYRACVVPTFEPGRRAGLGLDPYPEGRSSVSLAWGEEDSVRLPVYHSWVFTSAAAGDFESLARELAPTEFGPEIGFRDVDVSNPGPVDLKLPHDEVEEVGTVGLGGALRSVGAQADPYDAEMQGKLRELLNKPAEVIAETDYGAVGPPLYGQWYAGVPELEPSSVDSELYYYPTWFNTLNADPRHRIAAGYGTQVIQDEQERLMASAWEQFGDIREANRYLRRVQLAERIQSMRHEDVSTYSTGSLLGFTSPVHGHLLDGEETVHARSMESDLPTPLSSTTFRRLTRATGPIARRPGVSIDTSTLVTRLETGRLPRLTDGLDFTVEPPMQAESVADSDAVEGTLPALGSAVETDMEAFDGLDERRAPAVDGEQPTTPMSGSLPGQAAEPGPDVQRALTALDGLDTHVRTTERVVTELSTAVGGDETDTVSGLVDATPTVLDHAESISRNTFDQLSRSVAKVLAEPRPEELSPGFDRASANERLQRLHRSQRRLVDAVEAAVDGVHAEDPPASIKRRLDRASDALASMRRTSDALRSSLSPTPMQMQAMSMSTDAAPMELDTSSLSTIGSSRPVQTELPSKEQLRESVLSGIDPSERLVDLAGERLGLPNLRAREDPVESVLASPTFTDATYELLAALNQEYFLPGIGQIPKNSIGVLQTNPAFIEAFMAGLNHEFTRELRWRRYPTDRKGTYFRRFWNRKGNPDVDATNPEALADIEPIHTWDENDLGENSPRDGHAKVVLLIKGELLRRYPNTDIFAAKAVDDEGERVPGLPNTHVGPDADADADIEFPVFRGKLDPDITFFGFDLTPEQALYDPYHEGGQPEPDDHADEGWFFVLQEPPAETRFGMDVGTEADVGTTPAGITTDGETKQITEEQLRSKGAEHGWSALSWAHLVGEDGSPSNVAHVDVDGSRPGAEGWRVTAGSSYVSDSSDSKYDYTDREAATWGKNSAHMARATWQLPVRISIHADDMLPEEPPNDTDWRNVQLDLPATVVNTGGSL